MRRNRQQSSNSSGYHLGVGRAQTPSRRGSRVLKAHTPRAQQGSPGMPEDGTPRVSPLRLASLRHALSGPQGVQFAC